MAQKCVHKGCGKKFTDPSEDCFYHPGPPDFHEGTKGWSCCKPRVLSFDEFLALEPCTKGKHSTVDDTPVTAPVINPDNAPKRVPKVDANGVPPPRAPVPAPQVAPEKPTEPESDADNPSLVIPLNKTCRRRGCKVASTAKTITSREDEECIHHPGMPIFHEGSKGWTCCKKRVLEFAEFMSMEGCTRKNQHMFVGSGKKDVEKSSGVEKIDNVRHDFYQTGTTVHASIYLKKISKPDASIIFSSTTTIDLDLPTTDNKRYKTTIPLCGLIDIEKSSFKIMGTKLDLTLVKADGMSWPVLRADERRTGEIIQVGQAGNA